MKADRNLRLCDVVLDETIGRSTPDVEHERAVVGAGVLGQDLAGGATAAGRGGGSRRGRHVC